MADEGMTAHELRCVEHLKQVRALRTSVAEYARAHGLKARMLYDAEKQLRKKGVIAGDVPSRQPVRNSAEGQPKIVDSRFVAVRMERPSVPPCPSSPVLRVQHACGHILEFASWPPAEVMTAALSGGYDAAA